MRGDLRFQAWPGLQVQIVGGVVFLNRDRQIFELLPIPDQRAVVFDDAFQRLPGEVEAVEQRIFALKLREHAQRLRIVVEALVVFHTRIEHIFARMPERRMAEIVGDAERLGEIVIEAHHPRDAAGDLRHFQ